MSVQSIGQTTSNDWLQQLLASYGQSTTDSTTSGLLSLGSSSSDSTSATSADGSSSSSSVGNFNDILTSLLSGDSNLSYNMSTGMLSTSDAGTGTSSSSANSGLPPGLTRTVTDETTNTDGSTTTTASITDSSGNSVGNETTTKNADGSYKTVVTMTDPDGRTSTRTITGENTSDGGFQVTNTLTDASGNVLESGVMTAAADGSLTQTMTRNAPDGSSMSETESFDAEGNLVSSSTSTTSASASASASASGTSSTASNSSVSSSGSSSGAGGAGGGSGSSSSDTKTTVTMNFTSSGIEEITTVTDSDGNVVSQSTKEIPFNSLASGDTSGSALTGQTSLQSLISQMAASRYGTSQYANQDTLLNMASEGGGLSLEA